jgi:hypothetical protein
MRTGFKIAVMALALVAEGRSTVRVNERVGRGPVMQPEHSRPHSWFLVGV